MIPHSEGTQVRHFLEIMGVELGEKNRQSDLSESARIYWHFESLVSLVCYTCVPRRVDVQGDETINADQD